MSIGLGSFIKATQHIEHNLRKKVNSEEKKEALKRYYDPHSKETQHMVYVDDALGTAPKKKPLIKYFYGVTLNPDNVIMVMSDGIGDMLCDEEIKTLLRFSHKQQKLDSRTICIKHFAKVLAYVSDLRAELSFNNYDFKYLTKCEKKYLCQKMANYEKYLGLKISEEKAEKKLSSIIGQVNNKFGFYNCFINALYSRTKEYETDCEQANHFLIPEM